MFCHYFEDIPVEVKSTGAIRAFPQLLRLRSQSDYESLQRLASLIKRKGYSASTEKAYLGHATRFLSQLSVPIAEVTPEDIHAYMHKLLSEDRSSIYISQAISALRFWICQVESRRCFQKVWVRPKPQKKLPTVLSQAEVLRLLGAVKNLKHRSILTLVYSAGLRIGEVVKLKRHDVDPARKVIHIRQAKGGRTVTLYYPTPHFSYLKNTSKARFSTSIFFRVVNA